MQHLALYVWRKTIPCICGLEVVKEGMVLLSHYQVSSGGKSFEGWDILTGGCRNASGYRGVGME